MQTSELSRTERRATVRDHAGHRHRRSRASTSASVVTVGRHGTTPAGGDVEPTARIGDGSGGDDSAAAGRRRAAWAIAITGLALFMASLDNLVVTTALPVIRVHLHAGLSGLEWTVNGYTLSFAVLLLTAAAFGERFGRRRTFVAGIGIFTLASAAAALSPNVAALIAARAIEGVGGAMIMPLSLTLLSAAVPAERRNAALGLWGAIGGTAVAVGPLVGGAVTSGWAWQYIFWLNVPIGLVLMPLAWRKLDESRGQPTRLDVVGVVLASLGLLGFVLGLVRGGSDGWTSPGVVTSLAGGVAVLSAFVWWELRTSEPMLPLRLFRRPAFAAVNVSAMLFSFGMFGSIFFLSQFLQTVEHYSPFGAGLRILPWTAAPMLLAPVVGKLAERWGGKVLVGTGLLLQSVALIWLAAVTSTTTGYVTFIAPFVIAGVGMTLFFVPVASLALGSVPTELEGVASGTNAAFRELGGVLGIAVLGAIFSANGGYGTGQAFVNGLAPATLAGAGVVALGALSTLFIRSPRVPRLVVAAVD